VKDGIVSIENNAVLKLRPFSDFGGPVELVNAFGKKADYEKAVKELEDELYKSNVA
jgi:type I restriction enzyme R subunit